MDITPNRALDDLCSYIAPLWHHPDRLEALQVGLYVLQDKHCELNAWLAASADRVAAGQLIQDLIDRLKGPGYVLTGHAIHQTLNSRYNQNQRALIVRVMRDICEKTATRFNLDWFLTSGTLLGLIRDGGFIKHDDDLDAAYVTKATTQEEILAQRREIYAFLNSLPNTSAEDCAGGHFWVRWNTPEVEFMFDFFTSFVREGYLNEFPLRPMKLGIDHVLPTKETTLHGERTQIPANPEALLTLNYGEGWRIPDPNFRFDFEEHREFYDFLLSNKITA